MLRSSGKMTWPGWMHDGGRLIEGVRIPIKVRSDGGICFLDRGAACGFELVWRQSIRVTVAQKKYIIALAFALALNAFRRANLTPGSTAMDMIMMISAA